MDNFMEKAIENFPVTANVFNQKGEDVNKFYKTVKHFSNNERICKDCGNLFEISSGERQFYAEKGFELPKRCVSCRMRRKKANNCWEKSDFKYSFRPLKDVLEASMQKAGLIRW